MVAICVAVLAAGQVLFKEFSLRIGRAGGIYELGLADLSLFALAGVLYAASSVLWVLALRDLPLSHAYPFMALGYIIVPLAALVIYGEHLSGRYFLGVLFIVVGLLITAIPSARA